MFENVANSHEGPLKYSQAQRHGTNFRTLRSRPKRDERPDENGSLLLEGAFEIAVTVSECKGTSTIFMF